MSFSLQKTQDFSRFFTTESIHSRPLRGAGQPARVAGTRICGAGAGTRTVFRADAGRVRVELAAGAGRARGEKFFVRVSVEPKHMNLISSKIAKHVDVGY